MLKEYLESREKEVVDIMITLFGQEYAVEAYAASERQAEKARVEERERLSGLRKVMEKLNYSPEKAMDFMDIPLVDQPRYAMLLKESGGTSFVDTRSENT